MLKQDFPKGVVTRLKEISNGKDTLTGHFEIMGLKVTEPFPSFTDTGFPKELIDALESYSGRKMIGNIAASGTEIMKDLGIGKKTLKLGIPPMIGSLILPKIYNDFLAQNPNITSTSSRIAHFWPSGVL